jgi:hypothetical protein
LADTAHERSVWRYFDLADCFVQILLVDESSLRLADRPGINRAGYRRLVIDACMPEFRGDVERAIERLFPEDPLMVEDLLYQLCVEVNPGLDIHEVRLTVDGAAQRAAQVKRPSTDHHAPEVEAALDRIRVRALSVERRLQEEVLGQERAVATVARVVRAAAAGLGEPGRPLGSFLLTGRTGTGKTELARCLARHIFEGADRPLVRIDCSEFALAHEYSKLIGSPPGYVGHDDGGQLTDAVSKNPECVVLFDEVEKAHPKLHNLMLQVLEDGALTDGKGRRISFARTFVVMTSNCGAEDVTAASRAVGFGRGRSLTRARRNSWGVSATSCSSTSCRPEWSSASRRRSSATSGAAPSHAGCRCGSPLRSRSGWASADSRPSRARASCAGSWRARSSRGSPSSS